jgi:uncharacterized membrane protein YhdT
MAMINEILENTMWLGLLFLAGVLVLSYILTAKSKSVQSFANRFPQAFMILILLFLALLATIYFTFWLPLIEGG